jgi:hypothetical protein
MIWNPWKEIKRLTIELELLQERHELLKTKHQIQTEMLKHFQKNDVRGKDGRFKKAD